MVQNNSKSEIVQFKYSSDFQFEFEVQPASDRKVEHGTLPPMRKLVELIDGHPDFFYIIDNNQQFVYANKSLLKLWQKEMSEVAGKGFAELGYPPELQALHKKQLDLVFENKVVRGENHFVDLDGVEEYFEYIFIPLKRDHEVRAVGGISRNVTSRKRMEDEKEYLKFSIAHDLRTPLSVILSSAELLNSENDLSEQQRELLETISRNGRNMEDLILNLLDSAKVHSGSKLELKLEQASLEDIVGWVLKDLKIIYGVNLIFKSNVLGSIEGLWDRVSIRRLLGNLISNAAKHGEQDRPITVELSYENNNASLSVHNFGVVVPDSKLKQLEDLFDDTGGVKRSYGTERGWGIGLVVVRGIVDAFGGTITIKSEVKSGTTFTVNLPFG